MTNENKASRQKAPVKKTSIIYCIVASLLTILFVFWTGYLPVLLLIPLFIDIYITKFVPWGTWKNVKNPFLRKVVEWVDAIVFALVGVYIINTFFFQNYQIPSSSLEKTLLVGDFLCVSKVSFGARSPMTPFSMPLMQHTTPFDTKSYLEHPQLDYKRFKGTGEIKLNDIVVFNYPSGDTVALKVQNDDYYKLVLQNGYENVNNNPDIFGEVVYRPVDRRENYVKRCVGMPGDTISFINDLVYLNGVKAPVPEHLQLAYAVQTNGTAIANKVWEELGITIEDIAYISSESLSMQPPYSELVARAGLVLDTLNASSSGILYTNVFLTEQMVKKLEQKAFVLKVIPLNVLKNNLGNKRDMISNPAYPIQYYWNKEVKYGEFPAIWIPKRGATIYFDSDVDFKVAAYERCIKNYEHNDFLYEDGVVYINGKPADSYTFQFDYYFMSGDNRDNSADSRMWGFVPEDHIVGKPMFIWLSLDKNKGWFSGKIRWNRMFTSANKS